MDNIHKFQTLNIHRLRYGLQGSLIPFDTHTFVDQRQ